MFLLQEARLKQRKTQFLHKEKRGILQTSKGAAKGSGREHTQGLQGSET